MLLYRAWHCSNDMCMDVSVHECGMCGTCAAQRITFVGRTLAQAQPQATRASAPPGGLFPLQPDLSSKLDWYRVVGNEYESCCFLGGWSKGIIRLGSGWILVMMWVGWV